MAAKAMPREAIRALRESIARIEGKSIHAASIAAGDPVEPALEVGTAGKASEGQGSGIKDLLADACSPGAMTEVRSRRFGETGACTGLAMALALSCRPRPGQPFRCLIIADPMAVREAGLPYAPGLSDFGFGPQQVLHAMPRRIEDALWIADAALACGAFAAVLLEINGNPRCFGLTESRRFALKLRSAGGSLIVIRHSGEEEASSASLRLKAEPAPAAARSLADGTMLGGSIGNPVFRVFVEKSRLSAPFEILLEWNIHDRRLYPVPSVRIGSHASWRPADTGSSFSTAVDGSSGTASLGTVVAFERAS